MYVTVDRFTSHFDSISNQIDLNYLYKNSNYWHHEPNSSMTDSSQLLFTSSVTIIVGILCSAMSLATIFGNVLVITAFIVDKNLRSYSNYFILNLSIADLLIGLLIVPYTPFLLGNRRWMFGRMACTVWLVLDYVVGSASVLCIVVISLDRYLLVSRGIEYLIKQKISKAVYIMLTVWSIAFLNYGPAIIFWELITGENSVPDGECIAGFYNNITYLTVSACVEFFLPFIALFGLNLGVYLNIRKRSKGLIRTDRPHNDSATKSINKEANKTSQLTSLIVDVTDVVQIKDNPGQQTTSKLEESVPNKTDLLMPFGKIQVDKNNSKPHNKNRLSKDKKAARSLFILVFAFVVCWVRFEFDSIN
jgi:hypothetical protein